MSLQEKIEYAKEAIKEWYNYFDGKVYVSFSGGKDSTVLLDIVRSLYPEVEAVFCDTGVEFPEVREFIKTIDNVTIIRPNKTFKEVITDFGYPVVSKEVSKSVFYARKRDGSKTSEREYKKMTGQDVYNGKRSSYNYDKWQHLLDAPFPIHNKCCDELKKKPFKKFERRTHKKAILGTMAEESRLRTQQWVQNGSNNFIGERPTSTPLAIWTEQDILQYIKGKNIPYCSIYGDIIAADLVGGLATTGAERTGCMFCMFGLHGDKENRFDKLKRTHPKIYEYCMKPTSKGGLGIQDVIDYVYKKGK